MNDTLLGCLESLLRVDLWCFGKTIAWFTNMFSDIYSFTRATANDRAQLWMGIVCHDGAQKLFNPNTLQLEYGGHLNEHDCAVLSL